jgi:hypothetical protein
MSRVQARNIDVFQDGGHWDGGTVKDPALKYRQGVIF